VLCNYPPTPVTIMRRGESISAQVFKKLFPRPIKNFDPPTWNSHIRTNLLPELQKEIRRFYDELSPVEVRYPGMNYAHPHHRRRLNCNSFPHHQRLFKVMDQLGLTEPEIIELCNWDLTYAPAVSSKRNITSRSWTRLETLCRPGQRCWN